MAFSSNQTAWYALRVSYCREMDAKECLDKDGIENFLPLRYRVSVVKGKKVRSLVPVIHNLIFVKSTKQVLDELKQSKIPTLRYIVHTNTEKKREYITVSDAAMSNFIRVAGSYDEQLTYLDNTEFNAVVGQKVRIIGGYFENVEGIIARIDGSRNKRFIVTLPGFFHAAAPLGIDPEYIQVIE